MALTTRSRTVASGSPVSRLVSGVAGGEQFVEPRQQVVAADDARCARSCKPGLVEDRRCASAAQAGGFMPPALVMIFSRGWSLQDRREPFEDVEEIGGEAGLRVALLLQREDRHGQFGEVFEREVVEPAVLGQQRRAHRGCRPRSRSRCRSAPLHGSPVDRDPLFL